MSTPVTTPPASDAVNAPGALPRSNLLVRVSPWLGWVAMVLALLACLALSAVWQRLGKTREELARRSTDTQAEVAATRALASQAEAATQDMQARLSVAEVKLSEVSLQRSQLEELMLSVSRSRDDSLVQDLESSLRLAVQQSQLTGSVQPMISALQAADHRIARAAQPRLNPVQRAIARDIERIRSTPWVDVPTLVGRIDDLVHDVDEWPLLNGPGPVTKKAEKRPAKAVADKAVGLAETAKTDGGLAALKQGWQGWMNWWQGTGQSWWTALQSSAGDLLRVSRLDRPEAALLAPEQGYLLRENLKLQLLNARMGLLARQWSTAQQDVQSVQRLLARYFDGADSGVHVAQTALKQLQQDLQQDSLPRPEDTLAALTAAAGGR